MIVEDLFIRESLPLKNIFNIARDVDPKAKIPKEGNWRNRYDSLVAAIREGMLRATEDVPKPRFWLVRLDELARFLQKADDHPAGPLLATPQVSRARAERCLNTLFWSI